LLLATTLDPRIKNRIFTSEKQVEVRALLVKELEILNESQNDAVKDVENFKPPPMKIQKISNGASRIMQLLESGQQSFGTEEATSSKIISASYLKVALIMIFRKLTLICAKA